MNLPEENLRSLKPVCLDDIDNLRLLNRVDRKYLLNKTEFLRFSEKVVLMDYNVLTINNTILQNSETTYYDTPNLQLYLDHHNKRLNRVKIRIRNYKTTGVSFLEVKRRVNKGGETRKKRMLLKDDLLVGEEEKKFIKKYSRITASQLQPVAKTNFERFTLTSEKCMERVTIDFDLTIFFQEQSYNFKDIIILEVKRAKNSGTAGISDYLKEERIHPVSLSKYCLAVAALNPNIKHNAFKPLLRKLKINYNGNNA